MVQQHRPGEDHQGQKDTDKRPAHERGGERSAGQDDRTRGSAGPDDPDDLNAYDRAVGHGVEAEGGFAEGPRRIMDSGGGYQAPAEEGRRAYDPDKRVAPGTGMYGGAMTTDLRGMPEGSVEEIAAPFDEDAMLDVIDARERARGRGPKGYRRSDERIREEVCERLTDDPYVDASDIEVTVAAGEVTLAGFVESRSERRRAEDIAESVRGVAYVQNDLRARQPFYGAADRKLPPDTGQDRADLPTGDGRTATSGSEISGTAVGTGASGAGTGDGGPGGREPTGSAGSSSPA